MDGTPSGRKRDRGSTTPHNSCPERDRGPSSQGTSSIESCAKRPVVAGTTRAHGGSIGSQNVGHSRTVTGETTPGKGDGDPSRSHGICAGQTFRIGSCTLHQVPSKCTVWSRLVQEGAAMRCCVCASMIAKCSSCCFEQLRIVHLLPCQKV